MIMRTKIYNQRLLLVGFLLLVGCASRDGGVINTSVPNNTEVELATNTATADPILSTKLPTNYPTQVSPTNTPGPHQRNGNYILLYVCDSVQSTDLFSINLDNSEVSSLYTGDQIRDPTWSPDGKRVAFETGALQNTKIVIINYETGNLIDVEYEYIVDFSWSPDSENLVFTAGFPEFPEFTERFPIYLFDLQTEALSLLTEFDVPVMKLVWSPVGDQILLLTSDSGDTDLYILTLSGNLEKIPALARVYRSLVWEKPVLAVFYISTSGDLGELAELRRISIPEYVDQHILDLDETAFSFDISPDGKFVAFAGSKLFQTTQIQIVNIETLVVNKISHRTFHSYFPAWSPDGKFIAFITERAQAEKRNSLNLFSVGSGETSQIIEECVENQPPVWRP